MKVISRIVTALALFLPCGAMAQTNPYDIEIGYRWLDTSGNRDMYKSQINEQSGFLLRAFTLTTTDLDGSGTILDHLRVDASELGAGPSGNLRITAGKADLYSLRLNYRTADLYSALPAFANALLGQGIIPGQQTYDRDRDTIDIDLELLPGRRIFPLIGYSYNRLDGPGRTTLTLGGDEFRLGSDLRATDSEVRVGAAFNFGSIQGVVTQGWRDYEADEILTLDTNAGQGNGPGSILGRPITSTSLRRDASTHAASPFTQLFIAAQPLERLRLVANYDRFSADTDDVESDTSDGAFVSFPLGRFFEGRVQDVAGSADSSSWRGGIRADYALSSQFMLTADASSQHRELEGTSLISTLFIDTITFGGVDERDIETILATRNSMERDEDRFSIGAVARSLGPFTLRGEYAESRQDVTLSPDIAEIVVPGSQGGTFDRRIRMIDVGAGFAQHGFSIGAEFRRDRADEAVLRTDFIDRDRMRIRAGWHTPGNLLRIGLTAEEMNQDNDRPGIDFDAEVQQFSGDVEVVPHTAVRLRGSYSRFEADSSITIRRPENFRLETSLYSQSGDMIEGGVMVLLADWMFDGSVGRIENDGSSPFDIDRFRARIGYDVNERVGVMAEWLSDGYEEPLLPFADYNAERFGIFLRLRP